MTHPSSGLGWIPPSPRGTQPWLPPGRVHTSWEIQSQTGCSTQQYSDCKAEKCVPTKRTTARLTSDQGISTIHSNTRHHPFCCCASFLTPNINNLLWKEKSRKPAGKQCWNKNKLHLRWMHFLSRFLDKLFKHFQWRNMLVCKKTPILFWWNGDTLIDYEGLGLVKMLWGFNCTSASATKTIQNIFEDFVFWYHREKTLLNLLILV